MVEWNETSEWAVPPSLTLDGGVSVRALMAATQMNLSVCPEDVYSGDQIGYRLYANMPISIIGIFANILNVVIFCDLEMRTMLVNHFLLVLSISGKYFFFMVIFLEFIFFYLFVILRTCRSIEYFLSDKFFYCNFQDLVDLSCFSS